MDRAKTKGIVLGLIPYNDKTLFVHIYTLDFGLVTYAIPNTRSKRTKLPRSLFVPFTILDLEVEHFPTREIQKIAEARPQQTFYHLYADPVKNAVVLFLTEFLDKTIREQESNPALFTFIENAIQLYDLMEEGKANFHLVFLLYIATFLGFKIDPSNYSEKSIFDMMEGRFSRTLPLHSYYLEGEKAHLFYQILNMNFSNMHQFQFNRLQRNELLEEIILFYSLHLPDLKSFHSLDVIKTLFI